MFTLHCRTYTGVTSLCLPGLCSPRSFSSSNDSSKPGRCAAGTRSVDAAKQDLLARANGLRRDVDDVEAILEAKNERRDLCASGLSPRVSNSRTKCAAAR